MDGTETEFAQRWGKWLSAKLAAKQWSGADLRRAIEAAGGTVGASQVSRWTNGEQRPSLKGARLVADALGVSRSEVFAVAGHSEDIGSAESPPIVVTDPAEVFIQQIRSRGFPKAVEGPLIERVRAEIERRRQTLEQELDTVAVAMNETSDES
ncbi:MAG: helix-turn-helix domain-containing protein [Streptomyces sp.]|nr:helix-turn-helix domain-containing protein [Streptomyces sp.]